MSGCMPALMFLKINGNSEHLVTMPLPMNKSNAWDQTTSLLRPDQKTAGQTGSQDNQLVVLQLICSFGSINLLLFADQMAN